MTKQKQNKIQWIQKSVLPTPRSHPSVTAYNDMLYIFGGGAYNFASLNSVFSYNPRKDEWNRLKDMPTARSGTIALTIGNKIYVLGGGYKQPNGNFKFLTTVEIYDPHQDTWESGPELLMPHDYPAGIFLKESIYILGGHHPDATKSGPKTDPGFAFCERLILSKGVWEETAPLPTPRFALTAVAYREKILAIGGVAFTPNGFNNFSIMEEYDLESGSWRSNEEQTLPWPAAGHATAIYDNKLFLFGGYSGDGIQDRAAVYDFDARAWTNLPPIPARRAAMGIGILDHSIYLFGGWADDGRTPMDSVFQLSL